MAVSPAARETFESVLAATLDAAFAGRLAPQDAVNVAAYQVAALQRAGMMALVSGATTDDQAARDRRHYDRGYQAGYHAALRKRPPSIGGNE